MVQREVNRHPLQIVADTRAVLLGDSGCAIGRQLTLPDACTSLRPRCAEGLQKRMLTAAPSRPG